MSKNPLITNTVSCNQYLFDGHISSEPPPSAFRFERGAVWVFTPLEALIAALLSALTDAGVTLIHQHPVQAVSVTTTGGLRVRVALTPWNTRQVRLGYHHCSYWNVILKQTKMFLHLLVYTLEYNIFLCVHVNAMLEEYFAQKCHSNDHEDIFKLQYTLCHL